MLFYKVTAMLEDEKWIEGCVDRHKRQEHVRHISAKSAQFNQTEGGKGFCFVSDIGDVDVTGGMIVTGQGDTQKNVIAFFKAIGLRVARERLEEISFSNMRSLLKCAYRADFINDDDEVLERFGLDSLSNSPLYGFRYGEALLDAYTDKASLYETSVRLLTQETLRPELDRIYSGNKKQQAYGHPVHYVLQAGNREIRKVLTRTLLQALYDNRRMKNRRYCFVDIKPGQEFESSVYDALYKSCFGGTMVVRYLVNQDVPDSDYANGEMETISTLCETMNRYRNQVLTVFCLPRACDKVKRMFYEKLGNVSVVEIREDLADRDRAMGYLKMLCKDRHIRPDKKLCGDLDEQRRYYPDELRARFEEWYDVKMKTTVFPQYKDIQISRKTAVKDTSRGSAYIDLQQMIGLDEAKSVIDKAVNYYKLQKIYKDKGIKQDRPAMHMAFTGNPGTAKTSVARLFARIMKDNGLLSTGHLVEVGRSDLVGKFVGWTAQAVKAKFQDAMGGVLFIDEAYALVDERGGSFGDEAINTIVQEMENRREDLVVIFAGYPNEMENFLNRNPGLRSRIAFHVPFADYSADELCDIARVIGREKGVSFTDGAIRKLFSVFEAARQQFDFGNGRFVRNVIELTKMNQASRLLSLDVEAVTEKVLTTIEEADVYVPAIKPKPEKRTIGFAS
ncbi:MAG: AAA family ATPase [Acutalibacteraceae bacterium]